MWRHKWRPSRPTSRRDSILVSTLSKGAKTTNGSKVVVNGLVTLDKIAACIRGDSKTLPAKTAALRAALQVEGRKGRYETDKLLMPAILPAAQAPVGTAIKGLSLEHHNGLYGFDVDEQREDMDLAAVRQDLIAAPGAVMVGTSCAGDALFAIFAGPRAETDDDYKANWRRVAETLPDSAKANNGKASKNFNRLRFLAHDPNVWLADTVVPLLGAPQFPTQPEPTPSAPPVLDDRVADADAHVPSSGVGASSSGSNQAAPAGSNIGSSMRSAVPTSKTGAAR